MCTIYASIKKSNLHCEKNAFLGLKKAQNAQKKERKKDKNEGKKPREKKAKEKKPPCCAPPPEIAKLKHL